MLTKNDYLFMCKNREWRMNMTVVEARDFCYKIWLHMQEKPFVFQFSAAEGRYILTHLRCLYAVSNFAKYGLE